MTVRVYKSTDGSAPVLTGVAGSLVSLLDACLVNGYGAKTAAGWTINQTAANKRGYKQNLTGSNNASGMLLYVDDSAPTTAKEARCCGFETMSAITPTGTGQFPASGQAGSITGGFVGIRKSNTADATARPWVLVANGQSFYLFIESGDNTAPIGVTGFFFGDFKSYKTGDQYAVAIIGRCAENSSNSTTGGEVFSMLSQNTIANINILAASLIGHFMARRHTGIGGSVRFGVAIDIAKFSTEGKGGSYTGEAQTSPTFGTHFIGRYAVPYPWQAPNPVDGALWMCPIYLCHEGAMRGYLPGLWAPLHDRPLAHGDSITVAAGNLNGKSLLAQAVICSVTTNNFDSGLALVETSDTWS
jgi:hypothetical protein